MLHENLGLNEVRSALNDHLNIERENVGEYYTDARKKCPGLHTVRHIFSPMVVIGFIVVEWVASC